MSGFYKFLQPCPRNGRAFSPEKAVEPHAGIIRRGGEVPQGGAVVIAHAAGHTIPWRGGQILHVRNPPCDDGDWLISGCLMDASAPDWQP